MSRRVYCISGLGASEQVFSKLNLPCTELIVLKWLIPNLHESFADYSRRMFEQVTEENPVLMGVSFGGMTCIEMANQFPVQKLILISNHQNKKDLPLWMNGTGKLNLHRLIRPRPHPILYPVENFFLGAESKEDKQIANTFRKEVNPEYLQWAIHQIVSWKNVTIPQNYIHIHGTGDRLFPIRNVKADYVIRKGGHFMVYNKAVEISAIINRELELIQ
ncbi:MAG: alpha/beta hydrolase [Chitinophagaceae bacterium]|nr:alpha/beta hydrolase [Chitinophagaceae bacterium]